MASIRISIATAPRIPLSCASCLARPVDVFNARAERAFCGDCDEMIHDDQIVAVKDGDTVTYEARTKRAADWMGEGHYVFESTYGK